jgi:transglutaminase-like putative cysteine protease
MNFQRLCICLFFVVMICVAVTRGGDTIAPVPFALDPALAYRAERFEPVTYDVDYSVVVTAPYHTKVLKVWVPLPPSDFGQEVTNQQLSTFPDRVKPQIAREPVYGNEFAYYEFHDPQGGQSIRQRFTAKVWQMQWSLDPRRVTNIDTWPDSFAAYLRPQPTLAADSLFRATMNEIVPQRNGAASDLFSVINWIDRNLTYDHIHASLRADAQFAFTERRGHCSDYHGLCATMARSLGYPTRVTYGLHMFPKSSPSHCKMEAFLPPYGWVMFDVSETQKMVKAITADEQLDASRKTALGDAARRRLLGGYRDNTWLLVTKGTDYQLAPPATQPVPVIRTIYAEADGVPLPEPDPSNAAKREFSSMTVIDIKPDRQVTYPFADAKSLNK